MSDEFKFTYQMQADQYIVVKAQGNANAEQIEAMYRNAHNVAASHKVNKLLVDLAEARLSYPMEHFLPLMHRLKPVLTHFKTARVIKNESFRHDLVETVSQKSALKLKNFDDRHQAINWLLID